MIQICWFYFPVIWTYRNCLRASFSYLVMMLSDGNIYVVLWQYFIRWLQYLLNQYRRGTLVFNGLWQFFQFNIKSYLISKDWNSFVEPKTTVVVHFALCYDIKNDKSENCVINFEKLVIKVISGSNQLAHAKIQEKPC